MAVTTKKTFTATSNSTTTTFGPIGIELNNQDDLDVYITESGGTRVLQLKQSSASTADSNHPQVGDTTGLYWPAVSSGTSLKNYTISADNNNIIFNSALPSGAVVSCERRTRDGSSDYTAFSGGSTIRSTDLNNAFDEARFTAQEARNRGIVNEQNIDDKLEKAGGTMTGDITFASSQTFDATKLTGTNTPSDNSITSAKIANGAIVDADINSSAAISFSKLATGALPSGITVASANITDGTIVAGDLASDSVTTAKVEDGAITTAKIATGALDGRYYTETEVDANFYKLGSVAEIQSGETWAAADNKIATTSAIDARITDLVDDVGGFVPIANETSFPTANPDVNNGAGTLVSVKEFASSHTPSGGSVTIANAAGSGNTVTITGCGSTVLAAGFGGIVETTTTLHTYTFHRLTPKATEVTTVAANVSNIGTVASNDSNITAVAGNATNINAVKDNATNINTVATNASNVSTVATNISDVNNFADLYQIAASAPTTDGGSNALAAGDLWFDSSSNKTLKVHNGTAFQSVSPTQSVLDDISIVSGSLTRKEDLGSIADAIATDSSTGALDTCATNITNINTFANVYRVAANAPSSSLDEGDLWYDSTGNVLKYYNGTTWTVTAAAGMSELQDDGSPELGGHLDCNNKNLTEVATVSGDNLQIDFGSIA